MVDQMAFCEELYLENEWVSPIIGEDIFLTEPFKCTERCVCRRTPFQESSQLSANAATPQISQASLKSEGSWRCTTYLDRTFAAPDFPPTSLCSGSWDELFSNKSILPSGHNFIKEIFVNDRHLLKPDTSLNENPPKPPEPRQKFQRFRQKKFVCDECDRWFTMKQNVQQHFFQYHNPNGVQKKAVRTISKRFQCTKCNKIFKTLEKAQKHEARMHGENIPPSVFVCHLCNKVYNAHSQLKEHVDVVHENRRPFKCEHCGMDFGRAGGLRRHDMMVHQQKLHACPYEGCEHPGYKCTKALAAHIRSVHTMDRPFKCLFCDRSFVRKNDLKVHETTHSSQSEYVCKKCKCSFRRSIYLQKHEKRCTGKEGRRKLPRRRSRKDSCLVSSEQGSVALDYTTDLASHSVDECEDIVEEKFVEAEEAVEKSVEPDDEGHLSLEVTQKEVLVKEENIDAVEEAKDVVGEEDLEDGELSENSSVEYTKSPARKKSSHRSKRHHSRHSHHSRKKHKRPLLKLPRKSATRGDKEKTGQVVDVESENRDKVKTEQIVDAKSESKADEGRSTLQKENLGGNCYAQVPDKLTSTVGPLEEAEDLLYSLAKKETLIKEEMGKIRREDYSSRRIRFGEEIKMEEWPSRRPRYEPRDEAFIPKKRSLPVNSFSFLRRKHKLEPK